MTLLFGITSAVAVVATAMAVSRANAVHGLLYLVVSLLAVAGVFALLGAPLAAALEVIVYAGSIVVLFVFVVALLAQAPEDIARERALLQGRAWIGPSALTFVLVAELAWVAIAGAPAESGAIRVGPKQVAIVLYGPYIGAVEAASFLLLAGLVGTWHVGRGFRRELVHDRSVRPGPASPADEPVRKAS